MGDKWIENVTFRTASGASRRVWCLPIGLTASEVATVGGKPRAEHRDADDSEGSVDSRPARAMYYKFMGADGKVAGRKRDF